MMASRYSVDQSCSVAACTRGVGLLRRRIAAHLAAGIERGRAISAGRWPAGAVASTSSVSVAPHTPVRRILALTTMRLRHVEIGAAVDVGVADAFQMREHRHARFLLHARDQALAAARHDHVDGAVEALEHQADGLAVGGGHELDRASRAGPPRAGRAPGRPGWRGWSDGCPSRRAGSPRCRT